MGVPIRLVGLAKLVSGMRSGGPVSLVNDPRGTWDRLEVGTSGQSAVASSVRLQSPSLPSCRVVSYRCNGFVGHRTSNVGPV